MKTVPWVTAVVVMLLLAGCGRESDAESKKAAAIDCAVEIQIAVVSGLEANYKMDDGEWQVAATCVLPIVSSGEPGHVVCNSDGTIIELQWDDVRMTQYGKRIEFGGGQWRIRNRIDRRDGISQTLGGGQSSPPPSFGDDFEWLASCEIDTGSTERTGRRLVVRGRLSSKEAAAKPLNLAKLNATND